MRRTDLILNSEGMVVLLTHLIILWNPLLQSVFCCDCNIVLSAWREGFLISMAFHFFGSPSQEGSEAFSRCICCSKPLRNSPGARNWPIMPDEMDIGVEMEDEHDISSVVGLCHKHAGSKRAQGSGQKHGSEHDFGVIMEHFHDLESQVRLIRNENLEFKQALTRLFNLAHVTHLEVKHHNKKIDEKVEHLEETLGPLYPHKTGKNAHSEDVSSKLEVLGRNLDKIKEDMAQAGLHIANNAGKTRFAKPNGDVLNI